MPPRKLASKPRALPQAAEQLRTGIADLSPELRGWIEQEQRAHPPFARAFAGFAAVCRGAICPHLSEMALKEMLIQHLLTERIFRRVFGHAEVLRRNTVAAAMQKVVKLLTARSAMPGNMLAALNRFHEGIEEGIEAMTDTIERFSEKQSLLNTVYEKCFQGFNLKAADLHGIVYTPPLGGAVRRSRMMRPALRRVGQTPQMPPLPSLLRTVRKCLEQFMLVRPNLQIFGPSDVAILSLCYITSHA